MRIVLVIESPFSKLNRCRSCYSRELYVSRRRNFLERFVLRALYIQPVRCSWCSTRSYVPGFVEVRETESLHLMRLKQEIVASRRGPARVVSMQDAMGMSKKRIS